MQQQSIFVRLFRKKSIEQLKREVDESNEGESALHKNLSLTDLVCFGIAAIIGAGIFSTIGKAALKGGPAVSLLFILTAVACLFSALCYAEFASRFPISGSAYTYSFAAFGELIAWLIGWNLLMEYAIGNSVIAFSWSDYFSELVLGFGWEIPGWLRTDYFSCASSIDRLARLDQLTGEALVEATKAIEPTTYKLAEIWNKAPTWAGIKVILDVPALTINLLVTALVYVGIRESKVVSNAMVGLKICVVLMVILVGAFYVKPANWIPFAPNGTAGVLAGISSVFFTYIGFDAISTTAEECRDPQRDLPRATVYTLGICTVLYVILAFVLTGMVSYKELGVDDPLAFVFGQLHLDFIVGIISLSAVVAMTSVFLVFQLGQPRILMSMARDGLLPNQFARIHPRFKTPSFSTVVTGIAVAIPTLLLNSEIVTDLCSIGTLFAFMLVSAGILVVGHNPNDPNPSNEVKSYFQVPYFNSAFVLPVFLLGYGALMWWEWLPENHLILSNWHIDKVPYMVFLLVFVAMTTVASIKRWSLIPVLGVLTNLYLIAGLGATNWKLFAGWCTVGLVVYFVYGFRNSTVGR